MLGPKLMVVRFVDTNPAIPFLFGGFTRLSVFNALVTPPMHLNTAYNATASTCKGRDSRAFKPIKSFHVGHLESNKLCGVTFFKLSLLFLTLPKL